MVILHYNECGNSTDRCGNLSLRVSVFIVGVRTVAQVNEQTLEAARLRSGTRSEVNRKAGDLCVHYWQRSGFMHLKPNIQPRRPDAKTLQKRAHREYLPNASQKFWERKLYRLRKQF